jgi:SDR family mycofactocin-dependent oxidoreductase
MTHGRLEGKVAFITGAARGQGRSHAIRLAKEGADIIAIDLCRQVASAPYEMSTPDDLSETAKQVEALDRRIVIAQADVSDFGGLKAALDEGVAELGRLDIVSANAGIWSAGRAHELPEQTWQDMIDINLTGVWHTAKAAIPHLIAGGRGGSIILTSSTAGIGVVRENIAHYASAKHGVVGLMRTLALEVALFSIRVNSLHPTTVDTDMFQNEYVYRLFRPDVDHPSVDDTIDVLLSHNALRVTWVDPIDVSNALLFLASDEARYITGVALPIDAGSAVKGG